MVSRLIMRFDIISSAIFVWSWECVMGKPGNPKCGNRHHNTNDTHHTWDYLLLSVLWSVCIPSRSTMFRWLWTRTLSTGLGRCQLYFCYSCFCSPASRQQSSHSCDTRSYGQGDGICTSDGTPWGAMLESGSRWWTQVVIAQRAQHLGGVSR